ncbi:MAG TPA: polymorphic toxin type 23 domain-containing protein [Parafilimonas sp.]|nr:polymorphic toxin type 23 domain-containing protein [Parafilimonas sp.]
MRKRQVLLKPANANQTQHVASISAGAGVDINAPLLPNLKFYLQGSFNGYHGGIGTRFISNGDPESGSDLVLSFGGSVGWGHNVPIRIDMLNQNTVSAITNNNDVAVIYQTNIIYNKTGQHQVNASIGLRVYNFTLTTYNDVREFGLTDGNDRWLTGGFQGAWHFDNGRSITLGSDIFTGERIFDQEAGRFKRSERAGHVYYEESQTDILMNRGSIYIRVTRENGGFFMMDYSGSGAMFLQNVIHDNLVHVPRFMSVVPDTLMFYLGSEF